MKKIDPIDHSSDRVLGKNKIIKYYTIVKPRVERVHFVEKSNQGSLEDLMSGKMFLQKYKGVKQKMVEEKVKAKQAEERQKKTLVKGTNVFAN